MNTKYAPTYVTKARDWTVAISISAAAIVAGLLVGTVFFVLLPRRYELLSSSLGAGIGLLLVAGLFFVSTDADLAFVDIPDFSPQSIGFGALIGVVLVAVQGALTILFTSLGIGKSLGPVARLVQSTGIEVLLAAMLISLLLTAPVEELLFRNIVQKVLDDNHSTAVAILGSSLLFTAMHIPNVLAVEGIYAITDLTKVLTNAVAYGTAYAYWKRLDIVIVAHGLYNSAVFVIAFVI